jgi:hypothetical protein
MAFFGCLTTASPLAFGLVLAAAVGALGAADKKSPAGSYWDLPVPAQGAPPKQYLALARSLKPADCGVCHPRQFADWRDSLHAEAFSPGLAWQLPALTAKEQAACLQCHAPLAEQAPYEISGRPNPTFSRSLQATGVSCAACHVREHLRFGPPRRPGQDPGTTARGKPHGEVVRTAYFETSAFCAACHQLPGRQAAPEGKPLENTVAEWEASPFAGRGVSCQACHMPGRRHQWRGIHDPDTVRKGLTLTLSGREARLTNSGVGHMFPTYATPRAILAVELLDEAGRIVQTRREVIERALDFSADPPRELADTRLAPGATLKAVVPPDPRGRSVRASLVVRPDHFYERQFSAAAGDRHQPEVRRLLEGALRRTRGSSFTAITVEKRLAQ